MLFGSSSRTYRTCGNASCRCHSSGPKHGPHVYVNYKGEDGRTTGYYVPPPLHERVQGGLTAWREFYALSNDRRDQSPDLGRRAPRQDEATTKVTPTPIPIIARFTALLAATLLILVLYRIQAAITRVMAVLTGTLPIWRYHHDIAATEAPRAPQLTFAEHVSANYSIRDRHGGRMRASSSARTSFSSPSEQILRRSRGLTRPGRCRWVLPAKNQRTVGVFCTRL
jgi:hypothetical protein